MTVGPRGAVAFRSSPKGVPAAGGKRPKNVANPSTTAGKGTKSYLGGFERKTQGASTLAIDVLHCLPYGNGDVVRFCVRLHRWGQRSVGGPYSA